MADGMDISAGSVFNSVCVCVCMMQSDVGVHKREVWIQSTALYIYSDTARDLSRMEIK